MKRTISVVVFILMTVAIYGQDQWEIIYQGGDIVIPLSMNFINADTGWMAQETGLFRTFDGGENWELLIDDKNFRALEFIDGSIGWCLGEGDILLKTSDGGVNWDLVAIPDFSLRSVSPIGDTVVFALGVEGVLNRVVILKTIDGGKSWSNITSGPRGSDGSSYFMNKDTGLVIYDSDRTVVLRTFDGGDTWDFTYPSLNEVRIDKDINHQCILFNARLNSGRYAFCKTEDYFKTWNVLVESDRRLDYFDVDEGLMFVIVDSTLEVPPWNEAHILKSTDGGLTWKSTEHPPLKNLGYQLFPGGSMIRILASSLSTVIELESRDRGDHWSINRMSLPLNDIHFVNQYRGYMVAGAFQLHFTGGAFLTTEDGGFSWELRNGLGAAEEICFSNDSIGFIVVRDHLGGYGAYATTDGWDHIEKEGLKGIHCLNFINDSAGWAIGGFEGYWLSKTSDAGMTWEPRFKRKDNQVNLNSIFFLNEGKGYAVGNEGLIMNFFGEDSIRQIQSGTTLPLDQIIFTDNESGIITGGFRSKEEGYRSVMLRTSDGGHTWTRVPDMPYWINDVWFSNSLHGVAVGEAFAEGSGVILETADAGENWDVVTDTLPEPLRAVDFEEGIWWAVGDKSLILKNGTPGTSNNEFWTNQTEIPFLSYPNPFITNTIISYQLLTTDDVNLCIYDLSGRKLISLVNETQLEGQHEIEWNASGMQPGIYFCTLKTMQGRQVIKMILID